MGSYLSVGIAKKIFIKKRRGKFETESSKENALKEISNEIDLDIYKISIFDDYIILDIKEEILEKNLVNLLKMQFNNFRTDAYEREELSTQINKIENKKFSEIIEISKEKSCLNFQMCENGYCCNDISYISNSGNIDISADFISMIFDGKIIMECYYNLFYYLRKSIIEKMDNPLKTSIFITII